MTPISLFVPGTPRPGGSKTSSVVRRKGGTIVMVPNGKGGTRPLITTRDDAKGNAEWKQQVAFFARQKYWGRPLRGVPLLLIITFVMPRIKGHYGSGKNAGVLKDAAPTFHTVKPDVTKLTRSTEDALTGILWGDDTDVAMQVVQKVYGDKPGAHIEVRQLTRALAAEISQRFFQDGSMTTRIDPRVEEKA